MLDAIVGKTLSDAELPGLAHASEPILMLPLLAEAAGLGTGDHDALECSVNVLKHWPGKRCTLRYQMADRRRADAPPILFIGKVYRRAPLAARVYETTRALHTQYLDHAGSYSVPAPLALYPELGLVLQQHAPGVLLNTVESPDGDLRPFAYAGQWLARLHCAAPIAGLQVKTLEHELGRIEEWSTAIGTQLPRHEGARVHRAREQLVQLGADVARVAPAMTHRDFYPGNVLWDGQSICVIDFDWLAIGPALLDVGRFLAQIEKLSHRATGRGDHMAPAAACFLDAYVEANPNAHVTMTSLNFALAHTFFNLAADEVHRKRSSDWPLYARLFARRACEEAERAGADPR